MRSSVLFTSLAIFSIFPPLSSAAEPAAERAAAELDARLASLFVGDLGLTADKVAAKALETSYDVRAAQAELGAASARVTQALWAYVPRLSGSARYVRLSPLDAVSLGNLVTVGDGPAGPIAAGTTLNRTPLAFPVLLNQTSFQLSLTVPLTDYFLRLGDAEDAAKAGEAAARYAQAISAERAGAEARLLFYGWVRAKLQAVVAAQALEQARHHAEDAARLVSAGSASSADQISAEARVAQAELLVLRVEDLGARLGDQLQIVMHDPQAQLQIGEDVRGELPAELELELVPLAELRRQAREQRPELQALLAQRSAILSQANIARAGMLPRIDAFADATVANPSARAFPQSDNFVGTWDLGAQLSFTFTDLPQAMAERDAALAKAEATLARISQAEDGIDAEVMAAQQEMREARAAIASTQRQLVAAEAAYGVRRSLFSAGMAKSVELTDADTALTEARLAAVDARIDLRVGKTKLLRALGSRAR
jgi:outer membrane protein TolC